MATTTTSGFPEEAFAAFVKDREEPDWLGQRRREAFETFRAQPMPPSKDEEWRRTDIRGLKLDAFGPPGPDSAPKADVSPVAWPALSDTRDQYAATSVQANGVRTSHQLDDALSRQGVIFMPLEQAVRDHAELVKDHLFTRCVNPHYDKFSSLHAAFWTGGTFLYVPAGVRIEKPLFDPLALVEGATTDLSHTLVIVERAASVDLVQETASVRSAAEGGPAAALHVGAVELFVGPDATLRYVNLQNWGPEVWHFSHQRALVARDARIQWTVGGLGSRLSKVNQEVALQGQGSSAQVNGVMFTTGRQHLAYFTRQDHQAPNTTSDLLYKAALKDRSRTVWKGMIRVEKGAQKTDAYQKDDNLILGSHARADSIPGLEIEANDVRCTHGATAGRIDEEMLFYAMSRGLTRQQAVHLIVEGFFAGVYDRIPLESVRETLRRAMAEKLGLE